MSTATESAAVVYEGMRIWSDGSRPRAGVLGALLANRRTKALLGVTAAHLVVDRGWLYTDKQNVRLGIGEVASPALPTSEYGEYRPIIEALALIQIDATTEMREDHSALSKDREVGSAIRSFGAVVRRVRQDGSLVEGVLSGIECPIALRSKDTRTINHFIGALEISPLTRGEAFSSNGDSGSAVYGQDGSLLGIVLGGTQQTCFVAPLEKLLDGKQLALAGNNEITGHNVRMRGRSRVSEGDPVGSGEDLPGVTTWNEVDRFARDVLSDPGSYQRDVA